VQHDPTAGEKRKTIVIEGQAGLRWGVLGTGRIARDFARGLAASGIGRLQAVGSRRQESADAFAAENGAAHACDSYAAVLLDGMVEAVYVALPNSMHAAWAIAAAGAGKHILCEKPFTATAAEAAEVISEARSHDVFLLEAMLYRCHPQVRQAIDLVRQGAVGEVRLIECRFGTDLGTQFQNIRFSRELAGGSIMDVGCYAASYALLIAGTEPISVTGAAHLGDRSKVDEWAAATLQFPSGIVANLLCGTRVHTDRDLWLWGDRGNLHVTDPWKPWTATSKIVLRRNGAEPEELFAPSSYDPWVEIIKSAVRHCAHRQVPAPGMRWADSLATMRTLDAWRVAAGVAF
jgi:predicted dehydrogenase